MIKFVCNSYQTFYISKDFLADENIFTAFLMRYN